VDDTLAVNHFPRSRVFKRSAKRLLLRFISFIALNLFLGLLSSVSYHRFVETLALSKL